MNLKVNPILSNIKAGMALLIICQALLLPSFHTYAQKANLTQYVNPFIGTSPGSNRFTFNGNTGNVIPAATFPRGMVQWGPDTPSPLPGGYFYPDSIIKGFSVRHFSGRGCHTLQDFAFMPLIGTPDAPPSKENSFYGQSFSHKNEKATPGYYSVVLDNGLKIELTATKRTGSGKFTFPKVKEATLIINSGSSAKGNSQNTFIEVVGNDKIQGYATAKVGCGKEYYTIYFVARLNRPFDSFGTWNGKEVNKNERSSKGPVSGAFLTFDATVNPTVEAKIGLSFVSIKNAEENLNDENPGWNFNTVKTSTDKAWNNVLNRITVSGGTLKQKRTFYTALYHCFFHPNTFNDANGEYMGMDGKVHTTEKGRTQYENIPGWDIYRSATALTAMIAPDEASDIMQSLINYALQGGGGLPRWQQQNRNSGGMVGDGPVIMLANAFAFGAKNFDTLAALKAMDLNAGTPGTLSDSNLVRSNLTDYISKGYVPNSASVTLEYASADYALAQYAKALGDTAKYRLYLKRSENWKTLYNTSTGLIQPKNSDGSWEKDITPDTRKGYTEGSATQYTWMVPFDIRGLFDKMGGDSAAVSRLDKYFTKLNDGPISTYAFMGNEPCEGNPWMYSFAGAPYKTQGMVRRIQNELFGDTPNAFPGNDDAGALSSWYVFSALGIFPEIPGEDLLVLGSPLFPKAVVHLKGGDLTIVGNKASENSPYVKSLKVNGKQYSKPFIHFSEISKGGSMIYSLSSEPDVKKGTGSKDSVTTYSDAR